MSRTSYGYIAFKLPARDGATDDEIVRDHKQAVKNMIAALKQSGGELSTLSEVYKKSQAPEEDTLGSASIGDIDHEKI